MAVMSLRPAPESGPESVPGHVWVSVDEAETLAARLREFLASTGPAAAVRPGHRVKFQWPPAPVSYRYHVLPSDWSGTATLEAHGEKLPIAVARTPYGVFGRSDELWLEAKGADLESMLEGMRAAAEPFFQRMLEISAGLGRTGRFKGTINELEPLDVLKLLYSRDRDIANDARLEIEKRGGNGLFTRALIVVLRDETHPYRRSAQWCALDLFEDLGTYCRNLQEERLAVEAIRDLIWSASDDFARTTFKAGVVLGGHLPDQWGGPVLVECLDSPSKFGRRSAIHGLFHVVEWVPDLGPTVVAHLRSHAEREPEAVLAAFARGIADDLAARTNDHVPEPLFPEEN
jgi:hypothetical protein